MDQSIKMSAMRMEAMILAETYFQLVKDVPHILFELTWEGITGLVVYPFARSLWNKHHKRRHPQSSCNHNSEKSKTESD